MTLEMYCTHLRDAFKIDLDDEDLMIHVINNMSCEYDDLIDSLELQLGASLDTLIMVKQKEQLRLKFGRLQKKNSQKWSEKSEKALLNKGQGKNENKGKKCCNNYGSYDHLAHSCDMNE